MVRSLGRGRIELLGRGVLELQRSSPGTLRRLPRADFFGKSSGSGPHGIGLVADAARSVIGPLGMSRSPLRRLLNGDPRFEIASLVNAPLRDL